MLDYGKLLTLKRWNTPTIYNGWEQITRHDIAKEGFNLEPTIDFMPQMGPMIGYAVTVKFRPSDRQVPIENPNAWNEYRKYIASISGPKIVVVQDMDKPACIGAFWGEVNSNIHRALGCVGTITDGAIRDLDEMTNAGFKALARRLCVGHAFSCPVEWGVPVEVFGRTVEPGCLIHADKHGFLAIPPEDEESLLRSVPFMDANECNSLIAVARSGAGLSNAELLANISESALIFGKKARNEFGRKGEW